MRFEWADASPEADQYKVILESNIVFKPGTPKEEKEAISKIFFGEVNKADFETVDIRGIEIFTTRPDTLFGASFIALSPDHPLTLDMEQVNPKITDFRKQCAKIGTTEEAIATADKLGFDTGLRVKHPFDHPRQAVGEDNRKSGDPVSADGSLLGSRSRGSQSEPNGGNDGELSEAYVGDGTLINSGFLNGFSKDEGIRAAIAKIESMNLGQGTTQYRLRDWGVSRQRYWGCPIPVIKCETCGPQPVAEADLPVELPYDNIDLNIPGNPLDRHPTFKTGTKDNPVTCPKCGSAAERETDTLDTFADSSWYFARFAGGNTTDAPFNKKAASEWLPVDQYVGGVEHAVLHLLYARFFTRGLRDCGLLDLPSGEPFAGLFTQGMVTHAVFEDSDRMDRIWRDWCLAFFQKSLEPCRRDRKNEPDVRGL